MRSFTWSKVTSFTSRQLLCTYLIDPRHLQGEIRELFGSMAGSWQILQAGMDTVDEDVDSLALYGDPAWWG